jgi:hypothetical protein
MAVPRQTPSSAGGQIDQQRIHQMIVMLERNGLIRRQPGVARSIQILVPPEDLPILDWLGVKAGRAPLSCPAFRTRVWDYAKPRVLVIIGHGLAFGYVRVCPETSGWIAEFSEHEAD